MRYLGKIEMMGLIPIFGSHYLKGGRMSKKSKKKEISEPRTNVIISKTSSDTLEVVGGEKSV